MKLNSTLHVRPAAICLAFFTSMAALAQAPANRAPPPTSPNSTGNPANWPQRQDAGVSGKRNHKMLFENERVRVLEGSVSPGETEALHHHQWPSVLYFMDAGDFIDRDAKGNILLDTRTTRTAEISIDQVEGAGSGPRRGKSQQDENHPAGQGRNQEIGPV